MSKTNKPITLQIEDFKSELVSLINSSNLPPFILEPILKELCSEAHSLYEAQVRSDAATYREMLEKENSKEGE